MRRNFSGQGADANRILSSSFDPALNAQRATLHAQARRIRQASGLRLERCAFGVERFPSF
jgi:hypothetical protein